MKPNPQTTPAAPDWTRAKGLLADLKSTVRRSLAAQVLLGKELFCLKQRLGFVHGRNQWIGHGVRSTRTWDQWCQEELEITVRTAGRWIQCFQAALKRAKARKAREPQACRLLEIPADELTGAELEELAKLVQGLVDGETQYGLLEELGIVRASNKLTGGDTSDAKQDPAQLAFDQMAIELFSNITRRFGELRKMIFNTRDHADYRTLLAEIPLTSDDDHAPTLYAIRDSLKEVLNGDLAKVIEDVDAAIAEKEIGTPAKRARRKSLLTGTR